MSTKLSFPKAFQQVSGQTLLVLLTCLLGVFALWFDWINQQDLEPTFFIFIPLTLCALISGILGYGAIPILQKLKTGQIIQEDGIKTHFKKAGTPTMGGIFFVPVGIVVAIIWSQFNPEVIAVSLLTLGYLAIGLLDDWQVLRQQSNKGISPRMKLILQIVGAVLFCFWLAWSQPQSITTVLLPGGITLSLGIFFWLLAVFVMVGESNSTNLTDGVDGLAAGTCAIAFLGLGSIIASTSPGLLLLCACMSGSCLGFVVHNRNPAKVFMGDTGSLALGGGLAGVGLVTQNLWILLILSGIFFVESLSVVAQVSYYKVTKGPDGKGKRLLKMAPIHHHLELSGWSEIQIVGTFYLISAGLVLFSLVF